MSYFLWQHLLRSKAVRQRKSIELDKLIHNNVSQPVDKIFGEHHNKFNNLIGQATRDVVPPYYPSWDKVSAQFKEKIVNLQ